MDLRELIYRTTFGKTNHKIVALRSPAGIRITSADKEIAWCRQNPGHAVGLSALWGEATRPWSGLAAPGRRGPASSCCPGPKPNDSSEHNTFNKDSDFRFRFPIFSNSDTEFDRAEFHFTV